MPVPSAITDLSQTAGSNYPSGGESPITADNYFQAYASFIALLRDGKGHSTQTTLASATATDIGGQNSLYVSVTGTTTITGFGTNYNGPRFVSFTGALILTHSATLVIPGAANITTAAGDACIVVPISGGWKIVSYDKYSGLPTSTTGLAASGANNDITSLAALASVPSVVTTAITTATPASSATVSGLVELATTAETETGTDATRAATPAGLKGALLFSNGFESSDQTVTANSKLTIAHGLGAKPKFFQTFLKCNTAEANYTAGDEIEFTNMDVAGVSTCSTSCDATNMYIVHAGALRVNDKNSPFTTVTITTTSWRWVVRAWA